MVEVCPLFTDPTVLIARIAPTVHIVLTVLIILVAPDLPVHRAVPTARDQAQEVFGPPRQALLQQKSRLNLCL